MSEVCGVYQRRRNASGGWDNNGLCLDCGHTWSRHQPTKRRSVSDLILNIKSTPPETPNPFVQPHERTRKWGLTTEHKKARAEFLNWQINSIKFGTIVTLVFKGTVAFIVVSGFIGAIGLLAWVVFLSVVF